MNTRRIEVIGWMEHDIQFTSIPYKRLAVKYGMSLSFIQEVARGLKIKNGFSRGRTGRPLKEIPFIIEDPDEDDKDWL